MSTAARGELTGALISAYDAAAGPWAEGPTAYLHLAEILVARCPHPVHGATVLDLGAGGGAVSRAVAGAGGRPFAVDLSWAMLAQRRAERPPAAVGDAYALPFRGGAFDAVVAAFSISHLPDPAAGLAEAGRVTRPGGAVLASVFSVRNALPAKEEVERLAQRFGYRRPAWYDRFKAEVEPVTADPAALADAARAGGLHGVEVIEETVDLGLWTSAELVGWRLATPSLAAFAAGLSPAERAEFIAAAEAELGPARHPFRPVVLILSSRAAP